jgi:ribosomal protein S5
MPECGAKNPRGLGLMTRPLYAKDHVKRSEGQSIAHDVEVLIGDGDGQVGAATGAGQAVSIGDGGVKARGAMERDAAC